MVQPSNNARSKITETVMKTLLNILIIILCIWSSDVNADQIPQTFFMPYEGGTITRSFKTQVSKRGYHLGVDISLPEGTPVYAIADGVVTYFRSDANGYGGDVKSGGSCSPIQGYAFFIKCRKSDGSYFLVHYGHIISSLKVGDLVVRGQIVGKVDKFSFCTNDAITPDRPTPHLHLGIYDADVANGQAPTPVWGYSSSLSGSFAKYTDPIKFLTDQKVWIDPTSTTQVITLSKPVINLLTNYSQEPSTQTITVAVTNSASWTATSNGAWLYFTKTASSITISTDASLVPGTYSGNITVSSTGAVSQTITVNLTVNDLVAPTAFLSSRKFGSTGDDRGESIDVDSDQNIYLAGLFSSSISFDNITLNPSIGSNYFIKKTDGAQYVIWAKKLSSSNSISNIVIKVDANKNVIIAGTFQGNLSFDNNQILNENAASVGFILKLNTSGNIIWTQKIGLNSNTGSSINTLGTNATSIFIGGQFSGDAFFGGTKVSSAGGPDGFVAKLDGSNGSYNWVKSFGGAEEQTVNSLVCDVVGNVYLTGNYNSTTGFYWEGNYITSLGSTDFFLAKYSTLGNFSFVKTGGTIGGDGGLFLSLMSNGDLILNSFLSNSSELYFDGTKISDISNSGWNQAVLRLSSSGSLKNSRIMNSPYPVYSAGIATDNSDNVIAIGYFGQKLTIGSTNLRSNGGADLYLAKFTSDLNLLSLRSSGGTSDVRTTAIAVDPTKRILITGYFWGTTTLGITKFNSVGGSDIFVSILNPAAISGGILGGTTLGKISGKTSSTAVDSIFDDLGNLIGVVEGSFSDYVLEKYSDIIPPNNESLALAPVLYDFRTNSTSSSVVRVSYSQSDLSEFKSVDKGFLLKNDFWEEIPILLDTISQTITFTNVTSAGFLTFSLTNEISASLPVELSSFNANLSGNVVTLNWATATESNNSGWEIEMRHFDFTQREDLAWDKVGFVAGKGTTTETHAYSFVASNLKGAKAEFRLKQIDTDGKFSYSKILSVDLKVTKFELSQNYPNPFNPTTSIDYILPISGKVSLLIIDVLGREVATLLNEEKPAGHYTVNFDASKMPSGVYFYKLTAGNFSETKKMTLLK